MCAPCKVIINAESEGGAVMGSRIRELILNPPGNVKPDSPEDDLMYQLAEYEVDYILSTRKAALDYAAMIDAPPRWKKLMARLFGDGGSYEPDSPAAV